MSKPPWVIVAQDFAGEDGSTLYSLYDDRGELVTGAYWPQPLERLAADHQRTTVARSFPPRKETRMRLDDPDLDERGPTHVTVPEGDHDDPLDLDGIFGEDHDDPLDLDGIFDGIGEPADHPEPPARTCKIDGCTAPAKVTRGPYAYLCPDHTEQKKAAQRKTTVPAAVVGDGDDPIIQAVKAVLEAENQLLGAKLVLEELQATLCQRIVALRAILDEKGADCV